MKTLYILFSLFYLNNALENLQLTINDGILKGEELKTRLGRSYFAFKGIPYAKPPIGNLRFEPPQPPEKWTGIKSNPKTVPFCIQINFLTTNYNVQGDEDCLYLNVYTPKGSFESALPVMAFFHGGGFGSGSGTFEFYNPSFLLDKDIILVTTNYRLGSLGFLTTGDKVCPGNNGLKDQAFVLKWIQDNIFAFGGDKNLVTIFGESAGGASVEFHTLSPLSRGLFHRAIQESGSSIAPWSLANLDMQVEKSYHLGENLDCPKNITSEELIQCLRKVNGEDIIGAERIFKDWHIYPLFVFTAVIEPVEAGDERFLTKNPKDFYANPSEIAQVPIMIGQNLNEGALIAAQLNDTLLQNIKENYKEVFPTLLLYKYTNNNNDLITQKIIEFYYNNLNVNSELTPVIDMSGDFYFNFPIDRTVRAYASRNTPVYYYILSYRGEFTFATTLGTDNEELGVCHLDELLYIFDFHSIFKKKIESYSDNKMIDLMTNIWTEFAKNGKPPLSWPQVNKDSLRPLNYLEIKNYNEFLNKNGFRQNAIDFWSSIGDINDKIPSSNDEGNIIKKEEL